MRTQTKNYLTILLLLCASVALGQEITLECPGRDLGIDCWDFVYINGVTAEDMSQASVMVTPGDGHEVDHVVVRGRQALRFRAKKANAYRVNVGFNVEHVEWRKDLNSAIAKGQEVGLAKTDPALLNALKKASAESAVKYPYRGATCTIQVVAAHVPPDEPDEPDEPDPPAPVTFENAVKNLTLQAFAAGGTEPTATAISGVFAKGSEGLTSGTLTQDNVLQHISLGMKQVFKTRPDEAAWAEWRKLVSDALDTLRRDGSISNAEELATALREISNGVSRAVLENGAN